MHILGVGLSRTGTRTLTKALDTLGLRTLHFAPHRLREVLLGTNPSPDFRRYDDVDAVTDLPAAYFYEELRQVYPGCRFILTVRDDDSWWRSIARHFHNIALADDPSQDSPGQTIRRRLRTIVYGCAEPVEFVYKKKFREHNDRVRSVLGGDDLLELDIMAGRGWDELCRFLNVPVPRIPFPRIGD